MSANLQAAYDAAVEKFGAGAADQAAAASIEVFNTNALAGGSPDECEAEQLAAFGDALARLTATHLAALVADGRITQAQADARNK